MFDMETITIILLALSVALMVWVFLPVVDYDTDRVVFRVLASAVVVAGLLCIILLFVEDDGGERTIIVETADGRVSVYEGVRLRETEHWLTFTDPGTGEEVKLSRENVITMTVEEGVE